MGIFDFVSGRVQKMNELGPAVLTPYHIRIKNYIYSKSVSEWSREEQLIAMAFEYGWWMVFYLFSYENDLFKKQIGGLDYGKLNALYVELVLWFIWHQMSLMEEADRKKIDGNVLYDKVCDFFGADKEMAISFWQNLKTAENPIHAIFSVVCRTIGADGDDFALFVGFNKLSAAVHKKAIHDRGVLSTS